MNRFEKREYSVRELALEESEGCSCETGQADHDHSGVDHAGTRRRKYIWRPGLRSI